MWEKVISLKRPSYSQKKLHDANTEGANTKREKQVNETKIKMVVTKITAKKKFQVYVGTASKGKYYYRKSKGGSTHQRYKNIATTSLKMLHLVIKGLFTKEIANMLVGRLS